MGDTTDDIAAALGAALEPRTDVRVALLFGSQVTGRARPDSDVDLAILAGPHLDRLGLAAELSEGMRREVDLVDLRRAGVPLLDEILRYGRLVHEGERGAYATWRSAALLAQEIDRPWYARMRNATLARLAAG